MEVLFTYKRREFKVTTAHSCSSYGKPVLLVSGRLTDVTVGLTRDRVDAIDTDYKLLDLLADKAKIHDGPSTRGALRKLAKEKLGSSLEADWKVSRMLEVLAVFIRRGGEGGV